MTHLVHSKEDLKINHAASGEHIPIISQEPSNRHISSVE